MLEVLSQVFNIVLVHPEIPPNTGNVIRLAANTGCILHLIKPLGFLLEDKLLRRASLDYQEYAAVQEHASWAMFLTTASPNPKRMFALTTKGTRIFTDVSFESGDWLVFGAETCGLPSELRAQFHPFQQLRLPMRPGQRSLNLSNSVAICVFEAWRQQGFEGAI